MLRLAPPASPGGEVRERTASPARSGASTSVKSQTQAIAPGPPSATAVAAPTAAAAP